MRLGGIRKEYVEDEGYVMSVVSLSTDNFDEAIAEGKVLVDFYADWCVPCKMVSPIIKELADEYKGKVLVANVDVDRESALAARYGIMSIPTVILFSDGVEVKQIIGVQKKHIYESEL